MSRAINRSDRTFFIARNISKFSNLIYAKLPDLTEQGSRSYQLTHNLQLVRTYWVHRGTEREENKIANKL